MKDLSYFAARLPRSHKEKIECLQTMARISYYLLVTRAEGFLALALFLEQESDPLIKACMLDILHAPEQVELERRFEEYLTAGDYRGKDFLHAVIVLKGFLLIADLQKLEILWNELQGCFGTDFTQEYREAFQWEKDNTNRVHETFRWANPPTLTR
ncbi:hypothetical protein [Caproiciproducens galactitolivorans]|uniref:Uncharacterized protein n=1 Tax=Caproiciproducens galactitolivorans TaxID=642589 RepID=A0ABT4BY65_9FIRM|nr:hypothetical protein [Caproiciproducens galactitolivorans]MCY1714868.1 hypothetical protein [Caproiciproducens galactitolivorans]